MSHNLILYCNRRKNGKVQKRGKINLIGRLQLSTEKSKEEENEGIVQLRILRTQVTVIYRLLVKIWRIFSSLFVGGDSQNTENAEKDQ